MTFPTVLSPWFVVQRITPGDRQLDTGEFLEYYTAHEGDDSVAGVFMTNAKYALLFTGLQSAARVAAAEGAHIRVLTTKEEAEEFGRGETK